jgi:hypothetical protein
MRCVRCFLTAGLVVAIGFALPLRSDAEGLAAAEIRAELATLRLGTDPADEQAIRQLIEQYRLGYQLADAKVLVRVYADFTPALSSALSRYHQVAKNLTVAVENIRILQIDEREAVATFVRRDHFIDAGSGKSMQLDTRVTKRCVQQDGLWKMLASAELR